MNEPGGAFKSTIVVIQREQFSHGAESFVSLVSSVPAGQPIVYVMGPTPRFARRPLVDLLVRPGVRRITLDRYTGSNEARNIGWAGATTDYVVFVDNDVIFEPGWLEHLERCATESGAWAVAPITCEGGPLAQRVHVAGGVNYVDGEHHLVEKPGLKGLDLEAARAELTRGPVAHAEFHCMLLRRDALDVLGGLDEGMTSAFEHNDVLLAIEKAGGEAWIEPDAAVTQLLPNRLRFSELPYFEYRWSDDRVGSSVKHFREKWGLGVDEAWVDKMLGFARWRRRTVLPIIGRALRAARRDKMSIAPPDRGAPRMAWVALSAMLTVVEHALAHTRAARAQSPVKLGDPRVPAAGTVAR